MSLLAPSADQPQRLASAIPRTPASSTRNTYPNTNTAITTISHRHATMTPRRMLTFCLFLLVASFIHLPTTSFAYFEFTSFDPPVLGLPPNTTLPVLRIASTFSLTGSYATSYGTFNMESYKLIVTEANARGGVLVAGVKMALSLAYIDDFSAAGFTNYYYTVLGGLIKSHAPAPVNKLGKVDILFTPHSSGQSQPAITAARAANVTIWAPSTSTLSVFTVPGPFPLMWGSMGLTDQRMAKPIQILLDSGKIKTVAYFIRLSDIFSVQCAVEFQKRLAATTTAYIINITTPIAAGDPAMKGWFLTEFLRPEFPQVDMVVLASLPNDLIRCAEALAASKRTPGIAVSVQYYEEAADQMIVQEGWVGTFSYHPTVNIKSTLPGTVFADVNDFEASYRKMYPGRGSPNPTHAQDAGSIEAMLVAVAQAKSLSNEDLREANLNISGTTFLSDLHYNPTYGYNDQFQSLVLQVQNGLSVPIPTADQLVFPVQWPWTVPLIFTRSGAQTALMIVAFIALGLILIVAVGFIITRDGRVMHASSPLMLFLLLCGSVCLLVSSILVVQVPSYATCTSSFWLFNFGFTLALGSLFAKTLRLHSIFHSKQLAVSGWADARLTMLKMISFLIIWEAILLIIRTVVTPYQDHPDIQACQLSSDLSSDKSRLADAMLALLISTKGVLLIASAFLTFRVRNLPSLYNETSYLAGVIYNCGLICVIWLVIRYSFDFENDGQRAQVLSVIECAAMVLGTLITASAIFLPKFLTIIMNGEHTLVKFKRGSKTGKKGNKPGSNKKKLKERTDGTVSSWGGVDQATAVRPTGLNARASAKVDATGQPSASSAGTGTGSSSGEKAKISGKTVLTLESVRHAVQVLCTSLEEKIERLRNEYSTATNRVTAKKAEITAAHQTLAQVQAELHYLDAKGESMTQDQLQQMLNTQNQAVNGDSGSSSGSHMVAIAEANGALGVIGGIAVHDSQPMFSSMGIVNDSRMDSGIPASGLRLKPKARRAIATTVTMAHTVTIGPNGTQQVQQPQQPQQLSPSLNPFSANRGGRSIVAPNGSQRPSLIQAAQQDASVNGAMHEPATEHVPTLASPSADYHDVGTPYQASPMLPPTAEGDDADPESGIELSPVAVVLVDEENGDEPTAIAASQPATVENSDHSSNGNGTA